MSFEKGRPRGARECFEESPGIAATFSGTMLPIDLDAAPLKRLGLFFLCFKVIIKRVRRDLCFYYLSVPAQTLVSYSRVLEPFATAVYS
jgi:hypothetical protein